MAKKRPSATKRGYGVKHREVRAIVLKRDKYRCSVFGCKRRANTAAHIKALKDGGKTVPENMKSMCGPHHTKEHARERRAKKSFFGWIGL